MDIWMDNVQERSRRLQQRALAKGMDAPKSRCHGSFIYYSSGVAWCLSCYSRLTRGWPDRTSAK